MTVVVERRNVGPRVVVNHLPDGGPTACAEGVEYHANCGCVLIFGRRLDRGETTCAYGPCDTHAEHSDAFMARLLDDEGREIETSAWMAILLEELS